MQSKVPAADNVYESEYNKACIAIANEDPKLAMACLEKAQGFFPLAEHIEAHV